MVLPFRSSHIMEELEPVENYLLRGVYPSGLSKEEKAKLWWKCKNNFKLEDEILYYRKAVADGGTRRQEQNNGVLPCWSGRQVQIAGVKLKIQ